MLETDIRDTDDTMIKKGLDLGRKMKKKPHLPL